MHVIATTLWAPKPDEPREDAHWPLRDVEMHSPVGHFAVTDGATNGGRWSGIWAHELARAAGRGKLSPGKGVSGLREAQGRYRRRTVGMGSPWFSRRTDAGFASMASLSLYAHPTTALPRKRPYLVRVFGDCVVVGVRDHRILAVLPSATPTTCHERPQLLASDNRFNSELREQPHAWNGSWQSGDSFYLMTDAIARWFLTCCDAGSHPCRIIRDFARRGRHRDFRSWVAERQRAGELERDDITVTRVHVYGGPTA
ncbi:MAG: flagellar biosynthetic protein FliO [Planctomycetota bacterium]